jgi:diguanylate cyclase
LSEVLSGSQTEHPGHAAGGAALFPQDEPHLPRVGPFLMAAGTTLLVCLALVFCAFLDLLPWSAALEGTGGMLTLAVLFYLLFRTGLNRRFADPSLTTEQVGAAILFLAYIMYHAGPARDSLTLFYLVAMLFGVVRLNAKRLAALALLALVAHAIVLHLAWRSEDMDVEAALTEFAVLMIVLPWFAVMGGYVNRLRVRLADSYGALQVAAGRIEQLAIRDELTEVYNRRFLMETLARERLRAERLGQPVSICLMDIDHFKAINDSLGHPAGDTVLRQLPLVAAGGLRGIDVFGRFGGEEFLVVLPGTGLEGARAVAERMRTAVESASFNGLPAGRRITVTVGVAERSKGEDLPALLGRADRALYAGKAGGRNRVSIG